MKITKRELKSLIESIIFEEEENADTESEDEATDSGKDEFDNIEPFVIEVDGEQKEVKFFKDDVGDLQFSIDGETPGNKTVMDYVTLAAVGITSAKEDSVAGLKKIIDLDKTQVGKSIDQTIENMKKKMKTQRSPASVDDIRRALKIK